MAKLWGEAYTARERSQTMGRAMQLARDIFGAVAQAQDPLEGLPSQRAVLAGAIAEIQEQARAELRAELEGQARRMLADEARRAAGALERIAAAAERGELIPTVRA